MWSVFRPALEWQERNAATNGRNTTQISGLPDDISAALDPEYNEPDAGKRLRDGLLWAALEWTRVVKDTEAGPVITLDRASSPPPNSYALFVLQTYSLGDTDKRRDLIGRSLAFAHKQHDKSVGDTGNTDRFLHELDGWEDE